MKHLKRLPVGPGIHLGLVMGSLVTILWVTHPQRWHALCAILVAFIFYVGWSARQMPTFSENRPKHASINSIFTVISVTAGFMLLFIAISLTLGHADKRVIAPYMGEHNELWRRWGVKVLTYLACLVQEAALWKFLFPVAMLITRSVIGGCVLGAGVFGLLHAPNPLVAVASLALGILSFFAYRKGVSIFLVAACHLALSVTLRLTFPEYLHMRLRVGANAMASFEKLAYISKNDLVTRTAPYATMEYYQRQGGTDEAYMRGLYRDIMGREVSQEGVDTWVDYCKTRRLQDIVLSFVWEHVLIERRYGAGPATRFVFRDPL